MDIKKCCVESQIVIFNGPKKLTTCTVLILHVLQPYLHKLQLSLENNGSPLTLTIHQQWPLYQGGQYRHDLLHDNSENMARMAILDDMIIQIVWPKKNRET